MMKKSILILITVLVVNSVSGQSIVNDSNLTNSFNIPELTTIDNNPLVLIIIDSNSIKLNNINNYDIKPKWIESVDVLKDDISKQIYGNKNGVIIIYTKKKYRKRVLREIRNNNGITN